MSEADATEGWLIWRVVRRERIRAHAKHGATSMESFPPDSLGRLAILTEEVGEVAKEFNEARHDGRRVDRDKLAHELIQVAAMAGAWADAASDPRIPDSDTSRVVIDEDAVRAAVEMVRECADEVAVPADLWQRVRNIPSDRLPTSTWAEIQAVGGR